MKYGKPEPTAAAFAAGKLTKFVREQAQVAFEDVTRDMRARGEPVGEDADVVRAHRDMQEIFEACGHFLAELGAKYPAVAAMAGPAMYFNQVKDRLKAEGLI